MTMLCQYKFLSLISLSKFVLTNLIIFMMIYFNYLSFYNKLISFKIIFGMLPEAQHSN